MTTFVHKLRHRAGKMVTRKIILRLRNTVRYRMDEMVPPHNTRDLVNKSLDLIDTKLNV